MNREVHVRFRERLRGKFPRATRPIPEQILSTSDAVGAPDVSFGVAGFQMNCEFHHTFAPPDFAGFFCIPARVGRLLMAAPDFASARCNS